MGRAPRPVVGVATAFFFFTFFGFGFFTCTVEDGGDGAAFFRVAVEGGRARAGEPGEVGGEDCEPPERAAVARLFSRWRERRLCILALRAALVGFPLTDRFARSETRSPVLLVGVWLPLLLLVERPETLERL